MMTTPTTDGQETGGSEAPQGIPTFFSISEFIRRPLEDIQKFLEEHGGQLLEVDEQSETYIVKLGSECKVNHPTLSHVRGLIFNHKTGQVVSITYPVPVEYRELPIEQQKRVVEFLESKKYQVYEALDGTLLRLSYQEAEHIWLLSSNSKYDAKNAYWMSRLSYYEQFWSAHPAIDLSQLNQQYVYLFLLCHPLNVIVINHQKPKIYHVTTYDRVSLREVDCEIGLPSVPKMTLTLPQVLNLTHEANEKPVKMAGYILVLPPDQDGFVRRYRFENANYTKARMLRGETNHLGEVYLKLLLEGQLVSCGVEHHTAPLISPAREGSCGGRIIPVESKVEIKPKPKLDIKLKQKLEIKSDPKVEIKLKSKVGINPDPKVGINPDPKVGINSDPKLGINPDPKEGKEGNNGRGGSSTQEVKAECREEGCGGAPSALGRSPQSPLGDLPQECLIKLSVRARLFLEYYPIYVESFKHFQLEVTQFVSAMYQIYVEHYIRHQPNRLHPRIYLLLENVHQELYLDKSMGQRSIVTLHDLWVYLSKMPSEQIWYLLGEPSIKMPTY